MSKVYDFSNFNDQGYLVLPPGRYPVKVTKWLAYRKQETDNEVNEIHLEITSGQFEGQTLRYWHTVNDTLSFQKSWFNLLNNLGFIRPGDRNAEGKLIVETVTGEKDDFGKVEIVAIVSGGNKRPTVDATGTAVVVNTEYNDQPQHRVERLEAPEVVVAPSDDLPF